MQKIAAVLTIVASAGLAVAGPDARKYDPQTLAAAIGPFIDEQTIVVAHVDLARVDLDATLDSLAKVIGPESAGRGGRFEQVRPTPKAIVGALRKAKARDVFVVVSLADAPGEPILIVVPLVGGADERAIRGVLYSGRPDGPTSRPAGQPGRRQDRTQVAVVRNAVVRCNRPILQRVLKMTPHRRSELARAFAAAGDSAVQALLLPTANDRRVIEELLPELPPEVGGGPSTVFTRGMLWAALSVNAPPKPSLNLTIQSADADSAKAIAGLLDAVFKLMSADRNVRRVMPGIDQIIAALRPRVAGDRLVLNLPPPKLTALLEGPIAAAIRADMRFGQHEAYRTRLLVIGAAVSAYRRKHDSAYPPDLRAMVAEKMLSGRMLVSPMSGKPTYVYIRPPVGMTGEAAAQCVVIYEDPAAHGLKETHVLFADRKVRLMTVGDRFGALVKQAREASGKAYPQDSKDGGS